MQPTDNILEKCSELWDINNPNREVMQLLIDDKGLQETKESIKRSWSRQDMLNYHMGNKETTTGAIQLALKHSDSKIQAIKEVLDVGVPLKLDAAQFDRKCIERILDSHGREELTWAIIQNQYDYWNGFDDDELYVI
ncbi:MAG: hypothetical protein HWN79_17650 [Candidatus Lokiarchaeota archaeon]|nr:hypothetical protein [Candidatus Lokiarchaeota archaeon]